MQVNFGDKILEMEERECAISMTQSLRVKLSNKCEKRVKFYLKCRGCSKK